MYLKKSKTRSGRFFLSLIQGYRDEDNKVRQKTIENIGWLDELEKEFNIDLSQKYLTLSNIRQILK